MRLNRIFLIVGLCPLLFFVSCKERIDVPLNENVNKLVIEGEVHDQAGPYYVRISKSTAFNSSTTFLPYNASSVLISDNEGNFDSLVKVSDGVYRTTTLQGKVGNTYYLTVNDNGVKYTAQSKLNPCPEIDSFYMSYFLTQDYKYPSIVIRDPADETNYYRYFVRRRNNVVERMYIFEDKLINGTTWRLAPNREEFKTGDSCEFVLLGIDKANFEYFNILIQNQAVASGGNESASPTNPPTNLSGGDVLGIFSAHSRKTRKFVVN